MVGTEYRDSIRARGGDDVVRGRGGPDRLHGGFGDDRIHGGRGDDVIHVNDGRGISLTAAPAETRSTSTTGTTTTAPVSWSTARSAIRRRSLDLGPDHMIRAEWTAAAPVYYWLMA